MAPLGNTVSYRLLMPQEALFSTEMPSTQPFPILTEARSASVPLLGLLIFASEGDNVPDAVYLADCAANVVDLFTAPKDPNVGALGDALGGRWVHPPSWSHLFGRAVDVTLR